MHSVALPSAVEPSASAPELLLVGFSQSLAERQLAETLDTDVQRVEDPEQALNLLSQGSVSVLCLGDKLGETAGKAFLEKALEIPAEQPRCHLVLAAGPDLSLYEDFVARDQLYYLSQRLPQGEDLHGILHSALHHVRGLAQASQQPSGAETAIEAQQVLALAERLATESSDGRAALMAGRGVAELTGADRSFCLLYDQRSDVLWTPQEDGEDRRESAAAGIVSFVLRTGRGVRLERVGDDPRYEGEADNNGGPPQDRFMAMPVSHRDGRVLAVLVALRGPKKDPFDQRDQERLELLAEHAGPFLGRLVLKRDLDEAVARRHGALGSQATSLFREEALLHHAQGHSGQGNVLEISPGWTGWTFKLVVAVFALALLYGVLGRIHEYAEGTGLIRVDDRTDVTAKMAGSVVEVDVELGQHVEAGRLLARFYGAQELADVARIQREFELALAQRLRDPTDLAAERSLSSLRAQKEHAEARLEERSLRAPRSGVISDLRIRPGQYVVPGEVILSLTGENRELSVIAVFPGHYGPQIKAGMNMRLEMTGYQYAYQHLEVAEVSEEVVSPTEARRILGPGMGDALPLAGPVVFVYARLPTLSFESDGKFYDYRDGMQGLAEVRLRSEPILVTLVPGLKAIWSDRHG